VLTKGIFARPRRPWLPEHDLSAERFALIRGRRVQRVTRRPLRDPLTDFYERSISWRILPALRGRVVDEPTNDCSIPARCNVPVDGRGLSDGDVELLGPGAAVARESNAAFE